MKKKKEPTLCPECGKELEKDQAFCPGCGKPSPKPPKKPFPWKLIFALVLAVSLLLNVLLIAFFLPSGSIEGKGFDTPEEAITAYAEALREGDVDAMISTFAVESYVAAYDTEEYLNTVKRYMTNNISGIVIGDSSFAQNLSHQQRRISLLMDIKAQYHTLLGINTTENQVPLESEKAVADFLREYNESNFSKNLRKIEIGNIVKPEDLLTADQLDRHEKYLEKTSTYLGDPELRELAIEMEYDGLDYILMMQMVKLDGKWYNLTTNTRLLSVMELPLTTRGLVKESDLNK